MVKQARSELTRRAILTAAATVFVRVGYSAASISEIAAEAGITKGAMYFHFKSKELLARAVIATQTEVNAGIQVQLQEAKLTALGTLVLMTHLLAVQMKEDVLVRAGMRLAVEVGTFQDDPIAETYDDWGVPLVHLTTQAIADGDLRSTLDPEVFTRVLTAAFTGAQTMSTVSHDLDDLLERIRELWVVFLPGVIAPGREQIIPDLLAKA